MDPDSRVNLVGRPLRQIRELLAGHVDRGARVDLDRGRELPHEAGLGDIAQGQRHGAHAIDGISPNDFICAAKTDRLAAESGIE